MFWAKTLDNQMSEMEKLNQKCKKSMKKAQKIPEGHSNSQIENKLTTPWIK